MNLMRLVRLKSAAGVFFRLLALESTFPIPLKLLLSATARGTNR